MTKFFCGEPPLVARNIADTSSPPTRSSRMADESPWAYQSLDEATSELSTLAEDLQSAIDDEDPTEIGSILTQIAAKTKILQYELTEIPVYG